MQADIVFVMLVFSLLAIIFVISKLNRAIKLLNGRVNLHSSTLKSLKRGEKGESLDAEDSIKRILDKDFS